MDKPDGFVHNIAQACYTQTHNGRRTLFDHHLVIDQVNLVKMAKHPEMNQTTVHGYANHSNDSIFQMEIGRKPSQTITPYLPDYTSPF